MNRTGIGVIGVALLATGCADLGLEGNIPAEQSRTMPPPELVTAVMPPTADDAVRLVVDGRLWVPAGQPATRAAAELRPVGSAAGRTVYARAWDDRPFNAIFTRVEGARPEAATSVRAAMVADRQHWQEYAPATGSSGRSAPTGRFRTEPLEDDPGAPDAGDEPAPQDQ